MKDVEKVIMEIQQEAPASRVLAHQLNGTLPEAVVCLPRVTSAVTVAKATLARDVTGIH